MRLWRRSGRSSTWGTEIAEAATSLPVVVLLAFAMGILAKAWYAAIAVCRAAEFSIGLESVAQDNAIGLAANADRSAWKR